MIEPEKYSEEFTDELIQTNIARLKHKGLEQEAIKFKLLKLGFSSYEIRRVFEEEF